MNNQECIKHERFCQFRREIRGSKELINLIPLFLKANRSI
jgi:hypothetical protein